MELFRNKDFTAALESSNWDKEDLFEAVDRFMRRAMELQVGRCEWHSQSMWQPLFWLPLRWENGAGLRNESICPEEFAEAHLGWCMVFLEWPNVAMRLLCGQDEFVVAVLNLFEYYRIWNGDENERKEMILGMLNK